MNRVKFRAYLRIAVGEIEDASAVLLQERRRCRDDVDRSRLTKEADALDRALNLLEQAQLEIGELL